MPAYIYFLIMNKKALFLFFVLSKFIVLDNKTKYIFNFELDFLLTNLLNPVHCNSQMPSNPLLPWLLRISPMP